MVSFVSFVLVIFFTIPFWLLDWDKLATSAGSCWQGHPGSLVMIMTRSARSDRAARARSWTKSRQAFEVSEDLGLGALLYRGNLVCALLSSLRLCVLLLLDTLT
jgi:hypothetical protein